MADFMRIEDLDVSDVARTWAGDERYELRSQKPPRLRPNAERNGKNLGEASPGIGTEMAAARPT